MEDEHSFEQIREDIEARQRSILWPDYLRATRNVYEFLWNGDPKARPVQRIGWQFLVCNFCWLEFSSFTPLHPKRRVGASIQEQLREQFLFSSPSGCCATYSFAHLSHTKVQVMKTARAAHRATRHPRTFRINTAVIS